MRAAVLLPLLLLSCVGPPAPDYDLCRDVIERLCAPPACTTAQTRLNLPAMDCESQLEARTGCNSTEFTFPESMPRARVLDCRLPLVRESDNRSSKPSCEFVDETLRNCPDLITFLGGTP